MTLYRTIDTSPDIETLTVDPADYSTNAVALHTSSASHFLTFAEAAAHKKAQLTALADAAAALAAQAAADVTAFDDVVKAGQVSLTVRVK